MSEGFFYGPTSTHPDPGMMWHDGCGQEVLMFDDGYICGCGQQWEDAEDGSGPVAKQRITTPDAVTIIARHFIHGALERGFDNAWELYPEVVKDDWESVERRVKSILKEPPSAEGFRIAYDHLEARAQRWAREHPNGA